MKKTTYSLFLYIFFSILNPRTSSAQIVNGSAFLQGNRLEVGIANNGAYGTPEDAPIGYHPNNTPLFSPTYNPITGSYILRANALGFVADYDSNGWNNGTPPYFGDYFLPGTPQEGWSIEVDGVRSDAYSSNYVTNGSNGFLGGSLNGTNQNVTSNTSGVNSLWSGNVGNLIIKQNTSVKFDKLYCTGQVTLINSGTTTLHNIYYMRTVDPDNDVALTSNFTTINNIEYTSPNPEQKTLVSSTSTIDTNAYLGLATKDCRSKAFFCKYGLFPPSSPLDSIYLGIHPDLEYAGQDTMDVGIGIIYYIGDLLPGDSTELFFAYILSRNSFNEAIENFKAKWEINGTTYHDGDTVHYCQNSIVPINIHGGSNTNWDWSSNATLSSSTGITNNLTLNSSIANVTAIGSGGCVDTIHLVLVPSNMIYQTFNVISCNGAAYNFYGSTYTASGTYTALITSPSSCDTFATLNLIVSTASSSSSTINAANCSSYNFNGQILTSSGTYTQNFTNANGCDSVVYLNLTIFSNSVVNLPVTACNHYIYMGNNYTTSGNYQFMYTSSLGCDSVVTLQLTINQTSSNYIVDTSCFSYQIGAQTYTASGLYFQVLTNSVGCDSNITAQLTINGNLAIINYSTNGLTTPSIANSYQWLTCNPYSVISGATNSSYNPGFGGEFALVIELNGCLDTSDCVSFYPEGMNDLSNNSSIHAIPNPVKEIVRIESEKEFHEMNIKLLDLTGKILNTQLIHNGNEFKIDMSHLTQGVYILELKQNELISRIKLNKE